MKPDNTHDWLQRLLGQPLSPQYRDLADTVHEELVYLDAKDAAHIIAVMARDAEEGPG